MLNWIKGGGTLQFDWKWFMACEFSQEAEKKIKYQFKKAKYLADIFSPENVPRNSYKHIESITLTVGQKKTYGYGDSYRIKTNYGENAPLNCAIAVGLGDQMGTLDQWGAALGRYRLAIYIKGEIEKDADGQRIFTLKETIRRFADNFDYVDNPPSFGEIVKNPLKFKDLPSQPLGLWKHDIYDVQLPSKEPIDVGFYEGIRTDGYQYYLDNKTFQQLHPKIHRNKDYIGFLSISEEVQYDPNNLLDNTKLPIGFNKP